MLDSLGIACITSRVLGWRNAVFALRLMFAYIFFFWFFGIARYCSLGSGLVSCDEARANVRFVLSLLGSVLFTTDVDIELTISPVSFANSSLMMEASTSNTSDASQNPPTSRQPSSLFSPPQPHHHPPHLNHHSIPHHTSTSSLPPPRSSPSPP